MAAVGPGVGARACQPGKQRAGPLHRVACVGHPGTAEPTRAEPRCQCAPKHPAQAQMAPGIHKGGEAKLNPGKRQCGRVRAGAVGPIRHGIQRSLDAY